ncbi:MAG: RNA helicase [Gammaproteobacteria bacterium RBG_16_57_12]|nr:MAG: RNA helicase [Gammaproteobacteria bacterium RBG_16_57_12]
MSESHLSATLFSSLDLPVSLLQGIEDQGFSRCTPIQAAALPLALGGIDVMGQAQTGTGKTAAFLLAAMSYLLKTPAAEKRRPNQPRAFILAPTRELAIQIHKDAQSLGKHSGLSLGLCYGGTGYEQQRQQLAEPIDILIGTPGRLIDFFKQQLFDLRHIEVMVLDEADRMFDLGFIKDIRFLLRRMPPPDQRLNMLFSATLSWRVTELAYEHMNNPQRVTIEPEQVTSSKVTEQIYYPSNSEKLPLLLGLLLKHKPPRAIIFANTKRAAEQINACLLGNNINAGILSGDVPQPKRQSLLNRFQRGEVAILVATDVAARGLHIPEVSHVFNFDLPQDAEDYVHRIGRTARAGAHGEAISFCCEDYAFHLQEIEAYIGHKIPAEKINPELLASPLPSAKLQPRRPPSGKPASAPKRPRRRHTQTDSR